MELDSFGEARRRPRTATVAVALAVLATAFSLYGVLRSSPRPDTSTSQPEGSLFRNGEMHVGFGGFPPYTIIDVKATEASKRVTGLSVDLVNEIARRHAPPLKVVWHQFNWDTLRADMASGKFDFVADPVFQTIPRAADFGLAEPYSYFGIAVGVVRKGDSRFKAFLDLNQEGITIALAEGWTSSEFARAHLSKPQFKSIPVSGDAFTQLDEVLLGRADVALNDVPTVAQYVAAHPSKVEALWLASPPSMVPGGFLTRQSDVRLRDFLSASTRILVADGFVARLDIRWKGYGFIPEIARRPGEGLRGALPPLD